MLLLLTFLLNAYHCSTYTNFNSGEIRLSPDNSRSAQTFRGGYCEEYSDFHARRKSLAIYAAWFNRVKTTSDLRWEVKPVGIVRSPYINKFGVPKQATISARNGKN